MRGPLMSGLPLSELVGRAADRAALREPTSAAAVTYTDLAEGIDALARQLLGAGVVPGDRIALWGENGPEVIVAFLAVARAGAAAVPINPALTATEISTMLAELSPRALIMDADETRRDIASVCAQHEVTVMSLGRWPDVRVQGNAGEVAALPAPDPDAVCLLLQTSGTTSRPKTVPLRQRNLTASARNIAASYRLTSGDTTYCVMPLFHIHGLVGSTLSTLASGGTVVVPRRVRPSAFAADLRAHDVTWVSAVPTLLDRLVSTAARASAGRPEALRFARTSSSALSAELAARAEEVLGAPVLEAYGMTEASHQMASNPLPPARAAGGLGGNCGGHRTGGCGSRNGISSRQRCGAKSWSKGREWSTAT